MTTFNSVAGKIDAMPIDRIGNEVHDVTQRLAALSKSQEMTQSLDTSTLGGRYRTRDA